MQLVRSRFNRLVQKYAILKKLLGKPRVKRGLANFVGDISKTLFGTLTERGLDQIDKEFDKIYTDNNNMANVLSNHTRILKLILDLSSVNHKELLFNQNNERELARNLSTGMNTLSRDNFVNAKLLVAAIMIDETNEDIDVALNSINDGKHGIVHPQILTPAILKEALKEFEIKQRTRYHFDAEEKSYHNIIDICRLSVAVVKGLLTYILDIPIIEQEEGLVQRIILIPYLFQNLYFSIVPDYDYTIRFRDPYVPTDRITLEKCKLISEYKICYRNQPNIKLLNSETCESSILRAYSKTKCRTSPFLLHKEAFIRITNGYIAIPLKQTSLDIQCGDVIK